MRFRRVGGIGRRAAIALALLIGFYVLAVVIVGGIVAFNVAIVMVTGRLYWQLIVVSLLVVVAVGRGVFAVRGDHRPDGVRVDRAAEPALWEVVDDVAARMQTPVPDELILIPDVNAFVYEDTALLGLVRRHRGMGIGVALLNFLTIDQLRAVLAHEFGHYVGGDTRLSGVTRRARVSLVRTLHSLEPEGLTRKLFEAYARLFFRVTAGVSRQQELDADASSVRIGGKTAARAALSEVDVAAAAFDFFVNRYVGPVWEMGWTPDNIFEGLHEFKQHPERRVELDEIRAAAREHREVDPYDSHPPTAIRLAHLDALPTVEGQRNNEPARSMLRDPEAAERAVTAWWSEKAAGRRLPAMAWDDVASEVYGPRMEGQATELMMAVASVDRGDAPANLDRLCTVLEAGRGAEVASVYGGGLDGISSPERRPAIEAAVLHSGVVAVQAAALAAQPGARWELSWAAPVAVVTSSGERLDVDTWIGPGAADTTKLAGMRSSIEALGVDVRWMPRAASATHVEQPQILGAVLDVALDRLFRPTRFDVLVFSDALVLVAVRLSAGDRMAVGLSAMAGGGMAARTAVARVREVLTAPIDAILAADPANRRIPLADVQRARVAWRPYTWRLDLHIAGSETLVLRPVTRVQSRNDVRELLTSAIGPRLAG